jgi:hypothetical protein
MEYSFPEFFKITGKVVSIVVAPPEQIGASLPKYFTIQGESSKVKTSRKILAINAMVPSVTPLYSVIRMLESE